ncbi:MAG: tetratricopeptide repeat protein [Lewinellaceae bacterium]|nr:tetratricopeptide repeat protein [Lewinellaceae bacterium]
MKKVYQEAAEAYRDAGNDPKALYNLGNAQYRQGNYTGAAELFEKAATITKAKDKADALHNLGNSWLQQRNYPKAIEAYQNSLRLRPNDTDTKVNLQLAKKKLKEQQEQQGSKADQQPQQPTEQQQPNTPQTPDNENSQEPQAQNQAQQTIEEARKMLETAIGAEDLKSGKKYREKDQKSTGKRHAKDW